MPLFVFESGHQIGIEPHPTSGCVLFEFSTVLGNYSRIDIPLTPNDAWRILDMLTPYVRSPRLPLKRVYTEFFVDNNSNGTQVLGLLSKEGGRFLTFNAFEQRNCLQSRITLDSSNSGKFISTLAAYTKEVRK